MKNIAYVVLLVASFALGIFGAFMAYHGLGMPCSPGASMSDGTAIGVMSLGASALGVVFTCSHAITHSK